MSNFDHVFKLIVGEEGGFVDDPADRGGATKFGVTQKVLAAWRRHDVSVDDVKNLGLDEAKLIFRAQYWNRIAGDRLPSGVDLVVADVAFNSGTGRAAELLQKALGLTVDRVVGEVTISAANKSSATALIGKICDLRLAFLKTTYGWGRYKNGWSARVARVRAAGIAMANVGASAVASLADIPPMEGTAADHGQALTKTDSGQAKVVAMAGAVGSAASDAAQQISPLSDILPALKWVFIALTIIGIAATIYVQLRTLNESNPS